MRVAWVTYDFEEYSRRQVAALAENHDVLLIIPRDADPQHEMGFSRQAVCV